MKRDGDPGRGGRDGGPGAFGGYLRYLHLGTQMALLIVGGVLGGLWLDGKAGTTPAFTVTGSLAGIGLGIAVIIREVGRKGP